MRVFVTRPQSEARHWVEALGARGFDAQSLPLIDITAVARSQDLVDAWRNLEVMRAVMFVSVNAVRHFFAHKPSGTNWPANTRAWAPGPGTRVALLEAGMDVGLLDAPPADSVQFDSEALWQQVAGQVADKDQLLIVRGLDAVAGAGSDAEATGSGRDWLADQLAAAGAKVSVVAVYARRLPSFDAQQLEQARQGASPDVIWLFSSSQAIAHLRALLPGQDWSRARAVATHPRIAQAARGAGFGVVCESRPAIDAVVAALESFR